jgi:hypothetical protein
MVRYNEAAEPSEHVTVGNRIVMSDTLRDLVVDRCGISAWSFHGGTLIGGTLKLASSRSDQTETYFDKVTKLMCRGPLAIGPANSASTLTS